MRTAMLVAAIALALIAPVAAGSKKGPETISR
jgi:hypothetical protein